MKVVRTLKSTGLILGIALGLSAQSCKKDEESKPSATEDDEAGVTTTGGETATDATEEASLSLAHNAVAHDAVLDISHDAEDASFSCKVYKTGESAPSEYAPCDGDAGASKTVVLDAAENGSYTIEVIASVDGTDSEPASHEVYVHDSLSAAPSCELDVSDADLLAFAAAEASMASVHAFGENTELANPFVMLHLADDSETEVLSLRRHFVRSTVDGLDLVLMRRAYESRSSGGCENKTPLGFDPDEPPKECSAIAMNADGRGLCIVTDGSGNILASTDYDKLATVHAKVGSRINRMFSAKLRADDSIFTDDPDAASHYMALPE